MKQARIVFYALDKGTREPRKWSWLVPDENAEVELLRGLEMFPNAGAEIQRITGDDTATTRNGRAQ